MDKIYALNKERSVLSTLMDAHMNRINLEQVFLTSIKPEMFYLPAHQKIFELIYLYHRRNKLFTVDDIQKDLDKKEVSDSVIVEIFSVLPITTELLLSSINDIKEEYTKRQYAQMATDIKKMLTDENASTDTLHQFLENSLNNLSFADMDKRARSLTEVRKERKLKPERERVKTYIPFIDTVFTKKGKSGIKRGSLGFISGLKESGKTFILTRIIENVSKDMPVFFASLEFGEDDYDENIEEQQENDYFKGNTDNIFIRDDIYDINHLVAEMRYQHKVNKIGLAAIDSMLRITNNDPNHATNEKKLSDVFSKLGKLAKELDIPIIIIVQSSKEDLKSSIVSVKGCMDADHEAYWWYHLYKTHKNDQDSELRTVIWVKNKDTKKHPKQHLMFVPQTADFYRVEVDKNGQPVNPIDTYRKPKFTPPQPQITTFEEKTQNTEEKPKPLAVDTEVFDF